jgi:hypothetical protein
MSLGGQLPNEVLRTVLFIAFCCTQVQYFIAASGCGTMPSFHWGDAASVPSAGVTLFQTDLAFLPV